MWAKEISQSVLGSQIHVGERAWLQLRGCVLMGCQCSTSGGQGVGMTKTAQVPINSWHFIYIQLRSSALYT